MLAGDALLARTPEAAIHVGDALPFALRAPGTVPTSFRKPAAYRWMGSPDAAEHFAALNDAAAPGEPQGLRERLHQAAVQARASSQRVREAVAGYAPRAEYPQGALADDLKVAAALIHAHLPTRVIWVGQGGYDTHAGQRANHDRLMRDLGGAVAAFQSDLALHGEAGRVLTLAFSEFGRRVAENGSQGTDHGAAGPVLLLGEALRGGCSGRQPDLARLDDGDLIFTTDFRRVYATLLERWWGVPAAPLLSEAYEPLPFLA
jgi:uncharacterized protein (DUF1501 family)